MKDEVLRPFPILLSFFLPPISSNQASANNFQEIQTATASEPLSLEEEYAMQQSWRNDHDKLTFIACLPLSEEVKEVVAGEHDAPQKMIGDVNLFLSRADEDEEGCIGESVLFLSFITPLPTPFPGISNISQARANDRIPFLSPARLRPRHDPHIHAVHPNTPLFSLIRVRKERRRGKDVAASA